MLTDVQSGHMIGVWSTALPLEKMPNGRAVHVFGQDPRFGSVQSLYSDVSLRVTGVLRDVWHPLPTLTHETYHLWACLDSDGTHWHGISGGPTHGAYMHRCTNSCDHEVQSD